MFGIFGCNNHHYGEKEKTGRIKTIPNSTRTEYLVEHQIKRECVHEGCSKTKKEWKRVKKLKKKRLLNLLKTGKDPKAGMISVEPVFGGIKQGKEYLEPGSTLDLSDYSETKLDIKVDLE